MVIMTKMISEGWMQFLFVAIPVLSLIGTWMGLRTVGRLSDRRRTEMGTCDRGIKYPFNIDRKMVKMSRIRSERLCKA
ncbi:MAG: hypothetical protein EKK49_06340 [Rhodocyclaceae bacterium]|nr:MAG: hypothetical protein EKK49_06340 [Rhodocyclaceae bacterium]